MIKKVILFYDRQEAGRLLAEKFEDLKGSQSLFLAIPKGGVIVAHSLVQAIGGQLDVLVARKLSSPMNREVGIGVVTINGEVILDEERIERLGVSRRYLKLEIEKQQQEVRRRLEKFRGQRPFPSLKDKTIVVVDDGVATGLTMKAALTAVRKEEPRQLMLAVPVGPEKTIASLRPLVDRLEVLATPEPFFAMAQFYKVFGQCNDTEVNMLLREFAPE